MDENLSKVCEWSIWAHLDEIKNKELILLKGHLYIEVALGNFLWINGVENFNDFSFYRKIKETKKILEQRETNNMLVIDKLYELNEMRNKLAHEISYDIEKDELQQWSNDVLNSFEGMKFTRLTSRTKVVHAFSALSKVITDL